MLVFIKLIVLVLSEREMSSNNNNNKNQGQLGTLTGGGGGNSSKTIGGNVTYTTPSFNVTPNTSVHAFASRSGALNSFSGKTGSNSFGVGAKFRF